MARLKVRLLLIFLLTVVPLIAVVIYQHSQRYRGALDHAFAHNTELAQRVAREQERTLEGARQLLTALAELPELRADRASECSRLVSRLAEQYPYYHSIGAVDAGGTVYCASLPGLMGKNIAHLPFFQRALSAQAFTFSDYQVSLFDQAPVLYLAAPLRQTGAPDGIAVIALDLDWLSRAVAISEIPLDTVVTVVDRWGTVLARYPDPRAWVGQSVSGLPFYQQLSAQAGGVRGQGLDGQDRLFGTAMTRDDADGTLRILVGERTSTALAPAQNRLREDLGMLGSAALLVALLELIFGHRFILRPAARLIQATRRLAGGDLSARTGLHGGGELEELGAAFDVMAGTVQARDGELLRARDQLAAEERKFRLLAENARDLLFRYRFGNPRGYDYVSPSIQAILGISPEELLANPALQVERMHPEDRARLPGLLLNFETPQLLRYYHADGRLVWLEVVHSPHYDAHGELIAVDGISRDVTARVEAEAALRTQVQENQRLLEQSNRRAAELEAVARFTTAVRQADRLEDLLPVLTASAAEILGAHFSLVALLEDQDLCIRRCSPPLAEALAGLRIPPGDCDVWQALRSGAVVPVAATDMLVEWDLPAAVRQEMIQLGEGLAAPLIAGSSRVGVLLLAIARQPDLDGSFGDLLRAVCEIAGAALQRTTILERLRQTAASRTQELDTLYAVTQIASEPVGIRPAMARALRYLLEAVRRTTGGIFLLEDESGRIELTVEQGMDPDVIGCIRRQPLDGSLEGWVVQHNQVLFVPDLSRDPRAGQSIHPEQVLSYTGVPMRVQGRVVGVLAIGGPLGVPFNVEELALLGSIADHLALAVDNARLIQQSRQAAVHQERARLARDLHDSVTQTLYSASLLSAASLEYAHQDRWDRALKNLAWLKDVTHQALKDMRLLVYQLRSPLLEELGLVGALQHRLDGVEVRAGIQARLDAGDLPALTYEQQDGLYHIAVEALNNALKHAAATRITVSLAAGVDGLALTVADNGCGFTLDNQAASSGMGLSAMHERASSLGASFVVRSQPEGGASVQVVLPLGPGPAWSLADQFSSVEEMDA